MKELCLWQDGGAGGSAGTRSLYPGIWPRSLSASVRMYMHRRSGNRAAILSSDSHVINPDRGLLQGSQDLQTRPCASTMTWHLPLCVHPTDSPLPEVEPLQGLLPSLASQRTLIAERAKEHLEGLSKSCSCFKSSLLDASTKAQPQAQVSIWKGRWAEQDCPPRR